MTKDHEYYEPNELPFDGGYSVSKVILFHRQIGAPVATKPTMAECDQRGALKFAEELKQLSERMRDAGIESNCHQLKRAAMAAEEFGEWLLALGRGDLVAAADAFGDRLFLLVGDAVTMGLPISPLFHEIARSNRTKIRGVKNGWDKGVKGPNYVPPRIQWVLENASLTKEPE